MKQNEMNKLANAFGRKVTRICSFKKYQNPEKSGTTISHSAKNNITFQFKKDRERTGAILREARDILSK